MPEITVEIVLAANGRHEINHHNKSYELSAQATASAEDLARYYVSHNLPNDGNVSGRLILVVDENDNGTFTHTYTFTLNREVVARPRPSTMDLHTLAFGNTNSRIEERGAGDSEIGGRPHTRGTATRQSGVNGSVLPGSFTRQHANDSTNPNMRVDNSGGGDREGVGSSTTRASATRQPGVNGINVPGSFNQQHANESSNLNIRDHNRGVRHDEGVGSSTTRTTATSQPHQPDSVLPESSDCPSSDHQHTKESLPCVRCAKRIIHDTESHSASNKDKNRPDLNGTVRQDAYVCRKNGSRNCGYSVCQKEGKACLEMPEILKEPCRDLLRRAAAVLSREIPFEATKEKALKAQRELTRNSNRESSKTSSKRRMTDGNVEEDADFETEMSPDQDSATQRKPTEDEDDEDWSGDIPFHKKH